MDDGYSINRIFIDHAAANEWLLDLVNAKLVETMNIMPPPVDLDSGCVLADIGHYLTRTINILSQLAHGLAEGIHIEAYLDKSVEYAQQQSDLSELDLISYINRKHCTLRKLASNFATAAQTAQSNWQQSEDPPDTVKRLGKQRLSPNRPYQPPDPRSFQMVNESVFATSGGASGASTIAETNTISQNASLSMTDSPDLDENEDHAVRKLLNTLASTTRQKGEYYCPFGFECTKGGKSSDGAVLILFERPSAFKAHLQKHEKTFKCDLPGCRNTKGFSRIDQLRRHQETVSHQV